MAPDDWVTKQILTAGVGTVLPGAGAALDVLQGIGGRARQGRVGNRPGQPYAEGMDHGYTYQGNSGSNDPNYVWTGKESPSEVAEMKQNVEQVLRSYFVQVAGQQYPQYTTAYSPPPGAIAA